MTRAYSIILFVFIVLASLLGPRETRAGGLFYSYYPIQIWLDTYAPGVYTGPGYYPYYGSYSGYPSSSTLLQGGTRSVDYYVNRAQTKRNTPVVMTPKQMAAQQAKPIQKVLW